MKLSHDNLIDLTALSRLMKSADGLLIGTDGDFTYISDTHMAVRIRVPDVAALFAAVSKRTDGTVPPTGAAIQSLKRKKGYDVCIISLDGIKKFLDVETEIPVDDTRTMYETESDHIVRAMYVEEPPQKSYIFLDMMYLECINKDSVIRAVKPERTSPVAFSRGDEVAFVLPVNMHTPAFLVHVN